MSEKMTAKSCEEFISVLASSAPVPGGGGASALVGAIGTALGNMVGSLTVGKKKYADVQDEILELKARSDKLQEKLLMMVEKDAEVFEPLSKAYGLPSGTDEEKAEKERVMETVLKAASEAPFGIMELCMEAIDIVSRFSEIGSKIAISDAGCAAACCRAALNAASLNVFINTKLMKDRELADDMNFKADKLLAEAAKIEEETFGRVMDAVRP